MTGSRNPRPDGLQHYSRRFGSAPGFRRLRNGRCPRAYEQRRTSDALCCWRGLDSVTSSMLWRWTMQISCLWSDSCRWCGFEHRGRRPDYPPPCLGCTKAERRGRAGPRSHRCARRGSMPISQLFQFFIVIIAELEDTGSVRRKCAPSRQTRPHLRVSLRPLWLTGRDQYVKEGAEK